MRVRRRIYVEIVSRLDFYMAALSEENDVTDEKLLSEAAKVLEYSTWGAYLDFSVLAMAFRRRIEVRYADGPMVIFGEDNVDWPTAIVFFNGRDHFDAVISKSKASKLKRKSTGDDGPSSKKADKRVWLEKIRSFFNL
jgi:hypothetical protein